MAEIKLRKANEAEWAQKHLMNGLIKGSKFTCGNKE
jgi:hypothetical protein